MRYLSKRDFKELFKYEENDRDKRELQKEFKTIDKKLKSRIQFKDFIGKSSTAFTGVVRLLSVLKRHVRRGAQCYRCQEGHSGHIVEGLKVREVLQREHTESAVHKPGCRKDAERAERS